MQSVPTYILLHVFSMKFSAFRHQNISNNSKNYKTDLQELLVHSGTTQQCEYCNCHVTRKYINYNLRFCTTRSSGLWSQKKKKQ